MIRTRLAAAMLLFALSPAIGHGQPTKPADSIAKADRLIETGLAYLKSKQNADGSWGEANTPPGITALALRSFAEAGRTPAKDQDVARGYDKLLSYQLENGGIYKDLLANYNTAIALSALSAANEPRFKEPIDRAVAYLKGLQWTPDTKPEFVGKPDDKFPEQHRGEAFVKDESHPYYGGWGYGGRSRAPGRPDLSNAQMTIEALHDAGVDKSDPAMQRAIVFLSRVQNNSETNDRKWAGNDGGFIYSVGANDEGDSAAGETTDEAGNRRLRSYGSMTYAGLKSMILAGLSKDDPRVKAATKWIRENWTLDENPAMKFSAPDAGKSGLYYYYHTLARALAANGEPTLTIADGKSVDWRIALIDKVATLRQPDGSWVGEKRWMETNPILDTSYVVQALVEARNDLAKK
jgi:squalene-hopene/tetraprenyl-beta-curcumene cyclase